MDPRTVLAAVLGVGLGLVLLAAPGAVVRVHTAGRLPTDRHGEYGTEDAASPRTLWLVRALGGGAVVLGLYFGATAAGLA